MKVIEIMNKYGITIAIAGIIASVLCGLIKVPIAKKIREQGNAVALDNKIVADRIRNICNAIVVIFSVALIGSWYIATDGIASLLTTKVYADILATFTVAKLIYMLYEGAGDVSIKKVLHTIISKIITRNVANESAKSEVISPIDVVTDYLHSKVAFPLTDSQVDELRELLKQNK